MWPTLIGPVGAALALALDPELELLEPHAAIKHANRISARAVPESVVLDVETRTGFTVRYDTGETAEVSWSFIRELPPVPAAKVAETPAKYAAKKKR